MKLDVASAPAKAPVASKGRTVFVRTVTDERVFANSGDNPSVPSLETDQEKPEIRARAITRKSNSYGMALGDVLLEPGQTVAGKVGDALRQAFQQAGYTVVSEPGGAPAPIVVDVRVKKFWTWRRAGFTAITLAADIDTDVTITGAKSSPGRIAVHTEDDVIVAGPGATIDSLQKALAAYQAEAITKLASLKL